MSKLQTDQTVLDCKSHTELSTLDREESVIKPSESLEEKNNLYKSNQTVLAVTCLSFTLFVIAEIVGALV